MSQNLISEAYVWTMDTSFCDFIFYFMFIAYYATIVLTSYLIYHFQQSTSLSDWFSEYLLRNALLMI